MKALSSYAHAVIAKDEKTLVEDGVFIDATSQTFAVIDGVSSSFGKQACDLTIKNLNTLKAGMVNLQPAEILSYVNERLLEENINRQKYITPQKPLLASIAMAQISQNQLRYSNLGDSRVMLYRAGRLIPLTKDHSLLQEEIDKGYIDINESLLLNSPLRHVLTSCLGQINDDIPAGKINIVAKDVILICSDGITHTLLNSKLSKLIEKAEEIAIADKSEFIVQSLCESARSAKAKDDVSLIVVAV